MTDANGWSITTTQGLPRWGRLDGVTDTSDDGVDFLLRAREQFPLYARDDRPLASWTTQPEGSE